MARPRRNEGAELKCRALTQLHRLLGAFTASQRTDRCWVHGQTTSLLGRFWMTRSPCSPPVSKPGRLQASCPLTLRRSGRACVNVGTGKQGARRTAGPAAAAGRPRCRSRGACAARRRAGARTPRPPPRRPRRAPRRRTATPCSCASAAALRRRPAARNRACLGVRACQGVTEVACELHCPVG